MGGLNYTVLSRILSLLLNDHDFPVQMFHAAFKVLLNFDPNLGISLTEVLPLAVFNLGISFVFRRFVCSCGSASKKLIVGSLHKIVDLSCFKSNGLFTCLLLRAADYFCAASLIIFSTDQSHAYFICCVAVNFKI